MENAFSTAFSSCVMALRHCAEPSTSATTYNVFDGGLRTRLLGASVVDNQDLSRGGLSAFILGVQ